MINPKEIIQTNEDLNNELYEIEDIKQKIYTLRGRQVMLDSDVARLYHYETKNINKAVKRNISRFPEEFCFKLTEEEYKNLRLESLTTNLIKENMR